VVREVKVEVEGCAFIWDTRKAASNLKKHGVSFLEALEVLFDPNYRAEDASVAEEERYAVIGYSDENILLYVVVVDVDEETWRIVSARAATSGERKRYEKETDFT
jgi:uncharacterized protein